MKNYFPAFLLLLLFLQTGSSQNAYPPAIQGKFGPLDAHPDNNCNFAGTHSYGEFHGQSQQHQGNVVFLCMGDSILVQHNGDAILTGDPEPATPAGIGYSIYTCPPTISGDNLQAISQLPGPGDPCLLASPTGLYVTDGFPNGGSAWFFNNGNLISEFGNGKPLDLYFAPITLDAYSPSPAFEAPAAGGNPGPCVHVNTDDAFQVIYLKAIKEIQVANNYGFNKCIGKFVATGGYPEFDLNSNYAIDISLDSDPNEKAMILSPENQLLNQSLVLFSISKAGIYNISIKDGVSCERQFQMDMSGCNPQKNIVFDLDSLDAKPGEEICVPLRVRNFDVISAAFSVHWNPEKLQYLNYNNVHYNIAPFFSPTAFLNEGATAQGKFGMVLFDLSWPGTVIHIPDHEAILNLCFKVLDTPDSCSAVWVAPDPSIVAFEDENGHSIAITSIPGSVCNSAVSAAYDPFLSQMKLFPNPVKSGETVKITLDQAAGEEVTLRVFNALGKSMRKLTLRAPERSLSTKGLEPGVYLVEYQSGMTGGATRRAYSRLVVTQ